MVVEHATGLTWPLAGAVKETVPLIRTSFGEMRSASNTAPALALIAVVSAKDACDAVASTPPVKVAPLTVKVAADLANVRAFPPVPFRMAVNVTTCATTALHV